MRIPEAYNHWSDTYDTDDNLTRDLDQVVTQDTLSDLYCKSILEVGCGTGKNTVLLAQISEQVWDTHFDTGTNVVDVAVARLRRKIDGEFDLKLIETVRGVGYRMKAVE